MKVKICKVKGCQEVVHSKGFCNTHYQRILRTGSLDLKPRETRLCNVSYCENIHYARGFCKKHYRQFLKDRDLMSD